VVWLFIEQWGPLLVVEVHDPSSVMPVVGEIEFTGFEDAPESRMGLRLVVDQLEQVEGVFGAVLLPEGGKSVFFSVPVGCGGGAVSFAVDSAGGFAVLTVGGHVDPYALEPLRRAAEQAFDAARRGGVVVACEEVECFDASALGALMALHSRLDERGGALVVVDGPDGVVARALRATGTDAVVSVAGSRDQALALLEAQCASGGR
jgi:anti-anti-sigma factor